MTEVVLQTDELSQSGLPGGGSYGIGVKTKTPALAKLGTGGTLESNHEMNI